MFNRGTADLHRIRFCDQASCCTFNDQFRDPATHPPVLAGGALSTDGTGRARRTPVATYRFAFFLARKPVDQSLTRRTLILIIRCDVVELAAIELPLALLREVTE